MIVATGLLINQPGLKKFEEQCQNIPSENHRQKKIINQSRANQYYSFNKRRFCCFIDAKEVFISKVST